MKVKATKTGFIFCTLMKEGDEFTLTSEDQFSKKWMKKIESEEKPEKKKVTPKKVKN